MEDMTLGTNEKDATIESTMSDNIRVGIETLSRITTKTTIVIVILPDSPRDERIGGSNTTIENLHDRMNSYRGTTMIDGNHKRILREWSVITPAHTIGMDIPTTAAREQSTQDQGIGTEGIRIYQK